MGKLEIFRFKNTYLSFSSSGTLHIVYVIERFPSLTEYFILKEILELEKHDVHIIILSIRKPKLTVEMSELANLHAPILYSSNTFYFQIFNFIKWAKMLSDIDRPKNSIWSKLRLLKYLLLSFDFEKQLRDFKIEHIHAHFGFIASEVGFLLSKLLGLKFSFTAHAQDIYFNQNNIIEKIKDSCFVVTCTYYNWNHLNKITKNKFVNKIYPIYHGIDINERGNQRLRKFTDNKTVHILTVARLVEKKGIIYLLKAIKILTINQVNIICTIIGDGPLRKDLNNYSTKEGIDKNIKFLGAKGRAEVLEQISLADIFVLPCITTSNGDTDGLPNVLLEAMLMSVPVISTTISGIPELVEDGYTGILVPEKDEKSLANAIFKLITDQSLSLLISSNAKKMITNSFNIDNSTKKLIHLFNAYAKD